MKFLAALVIATPTALVLTVGVEATLTVYGVCGGIAALWLGSIWLEDYRERRRAEKWDYS